jgi:hypothetical protein
MRYAATGRVLWADREVNLGNVSTQMIVFPRRPGLAPWDSAHGHDHRFIANNLSLWPPGALVWREEVLTLIHPHSPRPAVRAAPARVEECPFRDEVRGHGAAERARCRLLEQILTAEGRRWCEVGRDACEACCASAPPGPFDVNPVVASLVYGLAEQIVERGGVAGCAAERAAGLRSWAETNLAFDTPSEETVSTPRREVTPCCHLGPEVVPQPWAEAGGRRGPVFACRHPAHGETTADGCRGCRDWEERPGTPRPPLERLVPPPRAPHGPRVRRWAVGVTTAPRRQPTLSWCLDSLARAGWECPRLFVDSPVTIPGRFAGLPVSLRDSKVGAWPNYYLAVAELLLREPGADALLLVQDDVVLYDRECLREYLERALWPAEAVGAVSLFCSSAYTRPEAGWYRPEGPWHWGAQALVFPRESAKRFLTDQAVLEHRWSNHYRGLANIDTVVGQWSSRQGLGVYHPSPSLAQHVGDTSTLWPNARIEGPRRADRFAGDL